MLLPGSDGSGEPVWVGADPTNRRLAGETHVKIGHGRFYADVPPVKGLYMGGAPPSSGQRHDVAAGPPGERAGLPTARRCDAPGSPVVGATIRVNANGCCSIPLHSSSAAAFEPSHGRSRLTDQNVSRARWCGWANARIVSKSSSVTISLGFVGLAVHRGDADVFVGRSR